MLVSTPIEQLLKFIEPFRLGNGRPPEPHELSALNLLIRDLAEANRAAAPLPVLERMAGMWECLFTTSRFVLDLDRVPGLHLSAVYQYVLIDSKSRCGQYFNIAELSRTGMVRLVCGEHAIMRPSDSGPARMDVQYEWFHLEVRRRFQYEGHGALGRDLAANRLQHSIRVPFRRAGWLKIIYLDEQIRIMTGSQGGLFILHKQPAQ